MEAKGAKQEKEGKGGRKGREKTDEGKGGRKGGDLGLAAANEDGAVDGVHPGRRGQAAAAPKFDHLRVMS